MGSTVRRYTVLVAPNYSNETTFIASTICVSANELSKCSMNHPTPLRLLIMRTW